MDSLMPKSCLPESICLFYDCRECLTVIDGVIMKAKHIVIPVSLCEKTLETLHTSQMGISKTIKRARTVIFWPNMQKDIEVHLVSCHPSTEFKIKRGPEPLLHDVPMVLWHSLTLDNFEHHGVYYLIVYDRFSRFIIEKKCVSLTVRCTIQFLLEIFTEHRIPSLICCNWGWNFVSSEFGSFCTNLGIILTYFST